jgi:hypothetical protein
MLLDSSPLLGISVFNAFGHEIGIPARGRSGCRHRSEVKERDDEAADLRSLGGLRRRVSEPPGRHRHLLEPSGIILDQNPTRVQIFNKARRERLRASRRNPERRVSKRILGAESPASSAPTEVTSPLRSKTMPTARPRLLP